MDIILESLQKFGLGVTLVLVLIWYVYFLTTKVLPRLLDQHRADLKEARDDFANALEKQGDAYEKVAAKQARAMESTLDRVETSWRTATEAFCDRLEANDRHIKANRDHVVQLREYMVKVMHPHGIQTQPNNPVKE